MSYEQEAIVLFFRRYNRVFISLAVGAIGITLGTQFYLGRLRADSQVASESYTALREAQTAWGDAYRKERNRKVHKEGESEEIQRVHSKVESYQKLLETSVEPYDQLSKLYDILEAAQTSDVEKLQAVADLGADSAVPLNTEALAERLVPELQILVAAKALVDAESTREVGFKRLLNLVANANVVAVSAAEVLASSAKSATDITEALKHIRALELRQPWQRGLLKTLREDLEQRAGRVDGLQAPTPPVSAE